MLDDKIEQGSSIIPFGLLSLSIATLLMGLTPIFQSRTAMVPYFTMALLFRRSRRVPRRNVGLCLS
jgi:hypothetical protein